MDVRARPAANAIVIKTQTNEWTIDGLKGQSFGYPRVGDELVVWAEISGGASAVGEYCIHR
ncbi:hypothetical protein GCM10009843_19160 [Nocardioides bigeumensis]|uniref:Uncharacterized protein n=1 Tax=Nocardioides bigeumensis TaxID=433657 RepID=A0ABN2Y8M4_9ACTN